ncbi:response regulator transcription factor [Luteococcus sp. H138]|uniref:response regulator transcription factor n=1 Tax=unclassified Luteococcus TaxID=2639923 RepID=UPI00313A7604
MSSLVGGRWTMKEMGDDRALAARRRVPKCKVWCLPDGPGCGMTIRVALCDDSAPMRAAWNALLRAINGIEVVGIYRDGREALARVVHDRVEVLLLDVRMPGLTGPDVARALRDVPIKVIYLTSHPDLITVEDAVAGVVSGALTKDVPPEDLEQMIHWAARGFTVISPHVSRQSGEDALRVRRDLVRSPQEGEVLDLVCRGLSNDQIAVQLNRSLSSVKQIVGRLAQRAHVQNRTQLALYVTDPSFRTEFMN